jgi:16S rRNA (guanine527-N7)-methyltransferase
VKHNINVIKAAPEVLLKARELYKSNEIAYEKYIDLLLEWNEKINVMSRSVSRETVREHIVHSLLPIPLNVLAGYNKWIDSGTGGGLPGIPIAISQPDLFISLNDNIQKKMMVVNDIVETMDIKNTESIDYSISLVELKRGTGILTKHAFKISKLLHLLSDKPWEVIVMWKGVDDAIEEIKQHKKKLDCTIYSFKFGENEPFYDGKGLLLIERS